MPPVVRLGDVSAGHCFSPRGNVQGSSDVFVNSIPAHRQGDAWPVHCCGPVCHDGSLASGSATVLVNNLQLGRSGDPITCGDSALGASGDVFAGSSPGAAFNSYLPEALRDEIEQTGRAALFDEPVYDMQAPENSLLHPGVNVSNFPPDKQPPEDPTPTDLSEPTVEIQEEIPECGMFKEVDYDINLSQSFKVGDLSIRALFKHSIKPQCGLTAPEILCNLKALCENVLEPLNSAFPGFKINSGFRTSTRCRSQHEKGQAVDIQWPGITNKEYLRRAEFIRDNILFDQEIMEHGNSVWIHLSYDRNSSPRRQVLTMYRQKYSPGLKLYYA